MIAVGKDIDSAKVYSVHKGYRMLVSENFSDPDRFYSVSFFTPVNTTYAKVEKRYGPVKALLFTWRSDDDGPMIAVGSDSLFAKVYSVRNGYRQLFPKNLGQMVKFMAVDEDTFKGPKLMLVSDIEKKYGPVIRPGDTPPLQRR